MPMQIEIFQRTMDRKLHPVLNPEKETYKMEERPVYQAQIAGKPNCWAAGATVDEAIGDLIRCHAEAFGIEIVNLEDRPAQ